MRILRVIDLRTDRLYDVLLQVNNASQVDNCRRTRINVGTNKTDYGVVLRSRSVDTVDRRWLEYSTRASDSINETHCEFCTSHL